MKIIHITAGYEHGGAALAVKTLHEGLRADGVDSSVVTGSLTGCYQGVSKFQSRASFSSRCLRWAQQKYFRDRWLNAVRDASSPYDILTYFDEPLSEEVARSVPDADVYHIHWTAGFVSGFKMLPTLTRRGKVVWTFHDMEPMTGGCTYAKGCQRFAESCGKCPYLKNHSSHDLSHRNWMKKSQCLDRSDKSRIRIHVASRWMEEQVRASSLWRDVPVTRIPLAIDTEIFHSRNRREAKLALGLDHSQATLLFAATRIDNPIKGFATLRKALELLPDKQRIHLLLVGNAVGISLSDLAVKTTHFGAVSNAHLMNLIMRASNIFAMPSQWETFGLTAAEAISSGCYCLLADTSGLRDIARKSDSTQLVSPDNPEEWSSQLILALDQVSQKNASFYNAVHKDASSEKFVSSYTQKLIQLYE